MLNFTDLSLQITADKTAIYPTTGQILPNQFIVLTGTSGSGKSLLLRLLSSLLVSTTGTITWQNQTLEQLTPTVWRSQIGFVQQQSELIDANVRQNLQLPFLFNYYKKQRFDENFHQTILKQLHKDDDFLTKSSQELSGGERQIVNLLRALQLSPSLLLLDEPTSALDPTTALLVENLLSDWQKNLNRSIVWISHDATQYERLIQQGAIHWQMDNGVLSC